MQEDLTVPTEKPRNGLAGLKHWRYDLRSGFTVAMISLPFSMGIAITSGAPPICGIVSAIIAGFVLPFLGGSYVTISGPAAGLAPVLFAGMILLGRARLGRDASSSELLAVGYPLVLVAIAIAGVRGPANSSQGAGAGRAGGGRLEQAPGAEGVAVAGAAAPPREPVETVFQRDTAFLWSAEAVRAGVVALLR